jgi:hypothetical protein
MLSTADVYRRESEFGAEESGSPQFVFPKVSLRAMLQRAKAEGLNFQRRTIVCAIPEH